MNALILFMMTKTLSAAAMQTKSFFNKMYDYTDKYYDKRLIGINKYIANSIFGGEEILSRLYITKDLRIILPEYNNIEIEMPSIAKAVYLLFLKNPDGFTFSELKPKGALRESKLRDMLIDICLSVIGRDSCDEVETYVKQILGNPDYDTIDDCCGLIYDAFASMIDVSIAERYVVYAKYKDEREGFPKIIDAEGKKYIKLPRKLIEWEEETDFKHSHLDKVLMKRQQEERKIIEQSLTEATIQERAKQACKLLDKLKTMPNGEVELQERIMSAHDSEFDGYKFPSSLNDGERALYVWKQFRAYLDSCDKKLSAMYSRNWLPITSNYIMDEQYIDLDHKELPIISLNDAVVETHCYSLLYALNENSLYDNTYKVPLRDIIEYSPKYISIKEDIQNRIAMELEKGPVDIDELQKDILKTEYNITWIPQTKIESLCGCEQPNNNYVAREPSTDDTILDDICEGWNLLEPTLIIKHLSDDFMYESQLCFGILDFDEYSDYLIEKFSTMSSKGEFVEAEIVADEHSECGKMILLDNGDNIAFFRIETEDGLVVKGDLRLL
jgi:hypothetical protein